ncbi:hypothetical protein [Paraburkholderia sp.]|uniref:hypothetical protein n=1 Tax=Paraburkholderia sp. TaxID=1926495 RepID=UPI003C72BA82
MTSDDSIETVDRPSHTGSQPPRAMLEHSVILAPGTVFSPYPENTSPYCRFDVAYLADPRFAAALRALG